MKLGKDEIQKIFLGGLMLIGLLYCYFAMLLGPLGTNKEQNEKKAAEFRAKIVAAKDNHETVFAYRLDEHFQARKLDGLQLLAHGYATLGGGPTGPAIADEALAV